MSQNISGRTSHATPGAWRAVVTAWRSTLASPHTRRSYETAWATFSRFLDGEPWAATSDDVNAWIASLRASGQARATIANRLAACASLYDYVARAAPELLLDARGRPRTNPFRSPAVARPRVPAYAQPSPLGEETVQRTLARINRDCLTGARDAALLLTFLTSGWRNAEVLGLTYAGPVTDAVSGEVSQHWRGGGARRDPGPLPAAAAAAILHYLVLAGRWPLGAGAAVWLPLRPDGAVNFGVAQPDPHQPISGTQANNILRRRLAAAGVAHPGQYHLRDLRHTFARKYLNAGGDLSGLGKRLRHARPDVTARYVARLTRPVDDAALLEGWL